MTFRRLRYPLTAAVALAAATLFLVAATSAGSSGTRAALACGASVTANVTLTGNLSCSGTDGLDVGANGVTINLDGHSITGNGSGQGVNDTSGHTGLIVENGIIFDFANGVIISNGGTSGRVQSLHVDDTINGIDIEGSDKVVVTKNTVVAGNYGIVIFEGAGDQVTSNVADENASDGISVDASTSVVITGNKSLNNTENGFHVFGQTTGTMSGNVASSNAADGIFANVTAGAYTDTLTMSKNRAAFNATFGIVGASPGTVDGGGNVVQDNGTAAQCQDIACDEVSN